MLTTFRHYNIYEAFSIFNEINEANIILKNLNEHDQAIYCSAYWHL